MKIVKCDVCGHKVEEHSNTIPPRDYWVKFIATYVGKGNVDISNMSLDICNLCYLAISAFMELLTKNKGDTTRMFIHQDRPLVDIIQEYVTKNLLKPDFYPSV